MFTFIALSIYGMSTLNFIAFWVVTVIAFRPACWISYKVACLIFPKHL